MKFLLLTAADTGEPVWLNAEHITMMVRDTAGASTDIYFLDGTTETVREFPMYIVDKAQS